MIPTVQAEWALRRLSSRAADYLNAADSPPVPRRHLPEGLGTRHANALVDLVAVAESFCVARLVTVGVTAEVNTWDKRARAWLTRDVDLANDCSVWSPLMGFVEARNAIQHGLGRLTKRQLSSRHKRQLFSFIAAATIRLNGDSIIIGTDDVLRCYGVCAAFIRWLDGTAPSPLAGAFG